MKQSAAYTQKVAQFAERRQFFRSLNVEEEREDRVERTRLIREWKVIER